MAHKTQKNKAIVISTDQVPQDYVAKLNFTVKGDHIVDICVTDDHLEQLVKHIQEFQQQRN